MSGNRPTEAGGGAISRGTRALLFAVVVSGAAAARASGQTFTGPKASAQTVPGRGWTQARAACPPIYDIDTRETADRCLKTLDDLQIWAERKVTRWPPKFHPLNESGDIGMDSGIQPLPGLLHTQARWKNLAALGYNGGFTKGGLLLSVQKGDRTLVLTRLEDRLELAADYVTAVGLGLDEDEAHYNRLVEHPEQRAGLGAEELLAVARLPDKVRDGRKVVEQARDFLDAVQLVLERIRTMSWEKLATTRASLERQIRPAVGNVAGSFAGFDGDKTIPPVH